MHYEKSRDMENPFKFGTIVEAEYFTDRVEEVAANIWQTGVLLPDTGNVFQAPPAVR